MIIIIIKITTKKSLVGYVNSYFILVTYILKTASVCVSMATNGQRCKEGGLGWGSACPCLGAPLLGPCPSSKSNLILIPNAQL